MKDPFRCMPQHEPEVMNARTAAELRITFSKEICVDGVRVMSRHADAQEITKVARAVRRISRRQRRKIEAICSDSSSSIYLVLMDNRYRIDSQLIADQLANFLSCEFRKPLTIYVFDQQGPIGIITQLRAD